MTAPAWHKLAACRGKDTSLFFSDSAAANRRVITEICGYCPVRDACLDDQMAWEKDRRLPATGVFGGMTSAERQHLARLVGRGDKPSDVLSGANRKVAQ